MVIGIDLVVLEVGTGEEVPVRARQSLAEPVDDRVVLAEVTVSAEVGELGEQMFPRLQVDPVDVVRRNVHADVDDTADRPIRVKIVPGVLDDGEEVGGPHE